MSSIGEIEFYDISCTITSQPWSPYTARTYLALRVLGFDFKHTHLPMAQIHATLDAAGVTARGKRHLLPAITLSSATGDKEWVTDSDAIASRLQTLYLSLGGEVSSSLFPDASARELAKKADDALETSLDTDSRWICLVPQVYYILEPESQQFFLETRTESWGKSPLQFIEIDANKIAADDGGIQQTFAKAMQPYVELYDNNASSATWLGGERPIYADLIVLAALQWYKCSNADAFALALNHVGGRLEKAWNAGQKLFNP